MFLDKTQMLAQRLPRKRPMFTQKTLRAALNFAQTENLKITDYQIKMLELFQNNNTSVQCLLGDHGS